MKVRVHLNLHRGDWSITSVTGATRGKVIENRERVVLRDVTFYVCESMRQKTIAMHRRKVHGWAQGELVEADPKNLPVPRTAITYRPFDYRTFVTREGAKPVSHCEYVEFRPDRIAMAHGHIA